MNETHAGDEFWVDQIGVKPKQLTRLELALVDQGLGGQRADVEPGAGHLVVQAVGHPLSENVGLQLKLLLRQGLVFWNDEDLAENNPAYVIKLIYWQSTFFFSQQSSMIDFPEL